MTKLAVVIAFVAVFAAVCAQRWRCGGAWWAEACCVRTQATAFAGEDAFIEESAESLIAELVSNAPAKQQQHGEASSVDFNNDREQMQTDKATEKLILDEIAAQWPERTKKTADVPSRKSKKARKGKRSEAALVEVVRR